MNKLCQVCHLHPFIGVASSSIGAMSVAYCQECANRLAEPEWGFEYLYCYVGYEGDYLADWVDTLTTFKANKYWTWPEWKAWRKQYGPKCPEIPIEDWG